MTESRVGTVIDGLEVIADEPTQWESMRDGVMHTVESVRTLLLSDGSERYACADCKYITTNQRSVFPHRKAHGGKAARRKRETAEKQQTFKEALDSSESVDEAPKPLGQWTIAETLAAIASYVNEIQDYTLHDLTVLFANSGTDWRKRALEAERKVEQFRRLLH